MRFSMPCMPSQQARCAPVQLKLSRLRSLRELRRDSLRLSRGVARARQLTEPA